MREYRRRSQSEWSQLVNEFQASGLSAPKFCKERDISYASFSKWRKRLLDLKQTGDSSEAFDSTPAFVEITSGIPDGLVPVKPISSQVILNLGHGMTLTITQP